MKLSQILYSRSLSQDYRWMLAPSWASSNDLKKLRQIYNEYDEYKTEKTFDNPAVTPTFYLNLSSFSAVVICSPSQQTDQYSRAIYGLQGIAVPASYNRHLWFALPWILLKSKAILNVWESINPKNADQLQNTPSSTINFDFETCDPSLLSGYSINFHQKKLEYSKSGFEQLINIISSSETSQLDFAFGATSELLNIHEWGLVAKVGQKTFSQQEPSPSKYPVISFDRKTDEDSKPHKSYTKEQDSLGSEKNKKASNLYSNQKELDESNTYDITCLEIYPPTLFSTGSGVYIHGTKTILDKLLKKHLPEIQKIFPRAVADFLLSDVYSTYTRNQSMQTVRIHNLGRRDADVGQWLIKQLHEDQWKDFDANGNRKNQIWLRRFKSLG